MKLAFILFAHFISGVTSVKIESDAFSVGKDQRCGNTILLLQTVKTRSKIECVATCQRTSGCDATNYNRQTRECELLKKDGAGGDCIVEVDVNSVYIQKKSMNLYTNYIIDCKTHFISLNPQNIKN